MVSGDGVVETEKGLDLVQLLPGGSDQLITVCNKNLKQRKKMLARSSKTHLSSQLTDDRIKDE